MNKKQRTPNPEALAGVPVHHPHEEYARMDANFKKSRGAKD